MKNLVDGGKKDINLTKPKHASSYSFVLRKLYILLTKKTLTLLRRS